jgi:pimeloyl-ACP methyl ester carboxylesterase
MNKFLKILAIGISFFLLLAAPNSFAQVDSKNVGIVLIHGKWGNPTGNIKPLADALRSNGYRVVTPLMPWSVKRGYDKSYQEAIGELDEIVSSFKTRGVSRVYVMGTSFGANGSIAYAAYGKHPIDGVVAIAPGHIIDLPRFSKIYSKDVALAGEMIKAGKGDEIGNFLDSNAGKRQQFDMKASTYWSYFDPNGMGSMSISSKKITPKIPLFVLLGGQHDIATPLGKEYIFSNWPEHPKSVYTTLEGAEHFTAPEFAIDPILKWLAEQN